MEASIEPATIPTVESVTQVASEETPQPRVLDRTVEEIEITDPSIQNVTNQNVDEGSEWDSLLSRANSYFKGGSTSVNWEWRRQAQVAEFHSQESFVERHHKLVKPPAPSPPREPAEPPTVEYVAAVKIQAIIRGWVQRLHFHSWVQLMADVELQNSTLAKCSEVRWQRDAILYKDTTLDKEVCFERRQQRACKERQISIARNAQRRQQILDDHLARNREEERLLDHYRQQQLQVNKQVVADRDYVKQLVHTLSKTHRESQHSPNQSCIGSPKVQGWYDKHMKKCLNNFAAEKKTAGHEKRIEM